MEFFLDKLDSIRKYFTRENVLIILLGMIGVKVIKKCFSSYIYYKNQAKLLKYADFILEERNKRIKDYLSKVSFEVDEDTTNMVLKLNATELVEKIKSKKISVRKVFIIYSIRCGTIGKDLNLIADANFEEGLKIADFYDKLISENPKNLPPLIGLPISLKDQFRSKNLISSYGMIANIEVDKYDSYLVKIMLELGAIPLCKSNVPQGLLALESNCYIWKQAKNPWNLSKTCGGSSGGEAGLIAARCSPLGIGTDIGGSIRNPANYCGIYGFKPTISKISSLGVKKANNKDYEGFDKIVSSIGPMSLYFDDILLFCRSFFGKFPEDLNADKSPFNEKEYSEFSAKKLNIGYSYKNSRFELCKGIEDKFESTLVLYKNDGHNLIEFPFEDFYLIVDKSLNIMANVGKFKNLIKYLKEEPVDKAYRSIKMFVDCPKFLYPVLEFYLRYVLKEERKANTISKFKIYNNYDDLFQAYEELNELKNSFKLKMNELKLDCLILPVQPFPALDHGLGDISSSVIFYTIMFNILDYPAGTIPLGLNKVESYSSKYNDKSVETVKNCMKTSKNLPIGVQVVTLKGEDEKCLGIIGQLSKLTEKIKNEELFNYFNSDDCLLKSKNNENIVEKFKNTYNLSLG